MSPLALAVVPLLLTGVPAAPPVLTPTAVTQTFAEPADADDPAIWVNPAGVERSVVLGTLKEGGLAAFDLRGRTLGVVPAPAGPTPEAKPGRFNNVDVLGDLAFVSDRGRDRVRAYRVSAAGVRDVTSPGARPVFSASEAEVDEQHTAYGLAAGTVGGRDVVVTSRRSETRIALLHVVEGRTVDTRVAATLDLPNRFTLPDGTTWSPCGDPGDDPQVEGMVIDSRAGVLYAAQEDVGIWRIPLRAGGFGEPELVDRVRTFGAPQVYDPQTEECAAAGPNPGFGGRWLEADAEGLTITGDKLIASSQGDSRFVLYQRTGNFHALRDFRVEGVEHSDGAAIVTGRLNLLVVHDGERPDGTGFAFLRW
ncbi:phytase [Actinokineospora spheciospongiae]|uniref:phytase n=1 Tax=Actinokineospora spheciospongiae TaxID=909613 RepID=UPI000D70FB18|nr:phytase [Actinokineospora spheciospongiae]PWW63121.1 3-phytase [Actinokineospora spheciospongiae]